jgi:hypothetical protein
MKIKMKFLLSLTFLLACFIAVQSLDVLEISDGNIDSTVGDGKGSTWLLLFYLETCPHCRSAKESFEKLSIKSGLTDEENLNNLQIGKIECSQNNWACLRFNITRVPTVYMLHDDKMFEFISYTTYEKLYKFLTEEKLIENGLPIPAQLGMVNILFKVFEESVRVLNEYINDFLHRNLNLNIDWNTNYTVGLLVFFLIFMIFIEYLIIFYCCGPAKKKHSHVGAGEIKEEMDPTPTENPDDEDSINKENTDDKKNN